MRTLRNQSLSLLFLAMFLAALVGQAIAGHADYNNDQIAHMGETVSIWRYLVSSSFGPGGDGELAVRVPAVHARSSC